MKILLLTPWYPNELDPDYGIFIRNMATALSEKHEVYVVFAKVDYSAFGFSTVRKVDGEFGRLKETRLYIKRSLPVYNQFNYFLITVWYSWKIARKFKPDLIHGNISYPGGFWAWMISVLVRRPYVITEHTRVIHNFRSWIHQALSVFSLKHAAAIHTVSQRMAEEITAITGKLCTVIPNVIVLDLFREIIPAPVGPVVQIGFLGNLDRPIKGLDILLTALAPLPKNFTLHVAGGGRLLARYKAQAEDLGIGDRCVFYGITHHWEVPGLMGKMNFFVNASRFESFGMAVLEAIYCGIPVIVTRCGGPEGFVTEQCGILVPVEDVDRLREALTWMMDHFHTYDPSAMRAYVLQNFSAAHIGKEFEELYERVLTDRARISGNQIPDQRK